MKTAYQCQSCGSLAPKWAGQCGDCGAWNSLVETALAGARGVAARAAQAAKACGLQEVALGETLRVASGSAELDRVLGGGLVAGAVVLIGGDPGIGKSTLLLQMLVRLTHRSGLRGLYVSGEESAQQIALRAQRVTPNPGPLRLLTETSLEAIMAALMTERPQVVIIDSIQTVATTELGSAPGSVGQVRESAARLVRYAKDTGTTVFLVGHVTKEGMLAGPRVLEHMVDTVLYFEGDEGGRLRILRVTKNRYGAVHELGVFAMSDKGLREVSNPSAIFLQRHGQAVAGSVVTVIREGTRPLLIEVQALLDHSHLANPRRVALGVEHTRLAVLLAVLHRHGGIATHDQDVFVNVVGGVRITETAADLALALAVLSSLRDRPLPLGTVVFGELGLSGEVRPVPSGPERLREAAKHGFKQAIVPKSNAPQAPIRGLEVTTVERLDQALALR